MGRCKNPLGKVSAGAKDRDALRGEPLPEACRFLEHPYRFQLETWQKSAESLLLHVGTVISPKSFHFF